MAEKKNLERVLKSISEKFDEFLKEVSKIAKSIEIGERHSVQITEPDESRYAEKEYYLKILFKTESLPEKIEVIKEGMKKIDEDVFSVE